MDRIQWQKGRLKMVIKKKLRRKDLELLPDPIWIVENGCMKPTPFFLGWWQAVAERQFRDKGQWMDAAVDLGYVIKIYNPKTGRDHYESVGFNYDSKLYRESLVISTDMPLVLEEGAPDAYKRLWDFLLRENENG